MVPATGAALIQQNKCNMKILVTGGTGFLGTFLTKELISQEQDIRVADIRECNEPLEGVEYFIGDLRSPEFCRQICTDVDLIYNLAALPSIAHGKAKDYYISNVVGLKNLLNAALSASTSKILHMSSSTIYGVPDSCPIPEDTPLNPIGNYSRSKLQAEEKCLKYREKGLNVNIYTTLCYYGTWSHRHLLNTF